MSDAFSSVDSGGFSFWDPSTWFGGGNSSSSSAPFTAPTGDGAAVSSPSSSSPFFDFSSLFSGSSSPVSATTNSSTSSPVSSISNSSNPTPNLSNFLAGASTAPTTGVSATSYGGFGGTDTATSPTTGASGSAEGSAFPSNYTGPLVSPSTAGTPHGSLSQIINTLGLGGVSTGDLIKGGVGAGGLLYDVLKNSTATPAQKSIDALASQQAAQGQNLESYLANGTLPPGAQAWVNQQTAAQKAAIQSKYAQMGMSGSTAELQELNNVDAQATAQMFQIASDLYNTGVNETGASANLYNLLMNQETQDNSQLNNAINTFVASLGGSVPTQKAG